MLGEFDVPNGGAVLKNASGEYTGLFVDAALQLLEGLIPKFSNAEMKSKLLEVQDELLGQDDNYLVRNKLKSYLMYDKEHKKFKVLFRTTSERSQGVL